MSDEFVLGVGQAHELEHAFRRNGWSAAEVKVLSMGNNLTPVREFILGRAEIKLREMAPEPPQQLLEPVGTITIPALLGRFSVREKFVVNYGRKAKLGVRIASLGDNFKDWFGDVAEEPTAEAVVSYAQLTHSELDGPILTSLGTRSELAVFLRQIYWLMEQQPNGEPGTLLNNGRASIFYMPGLTRAVYVYWDAGVGGWDVDADDVASPDGWGDGDRVFSRNSSGAVAV